MIVDNSGGIVPGGGNVPRAGNRGVTDAGTILRAGTIAETIPSSVTGIGTNPKAATV